MTSARRHTQRGFTLVELMIVVAIIAILGAFLVGLMSRPYGANAETLSDQVSATLGYARTRAISTRRTHKVTIYNTTSGGVPEQIILIEANDQTGTRITPVTAYQTVEFRRLPSNSIIWSAATGIPTTGQSPTQNTGLPLTLYFRPDGSVTSAATIYITDRMGTPKKYRVVLVQATGSSYARQTW